MTLVLAGGETQIVTAAVAKVISAGAYYTCILTDAGGVQCWGHNDDGQLGNGTTVDTNMPVDVSGLDNRIINVSAGLSHTCVLTETGGVKCWGNNSGGELGNGTYIDSITPVDVSGLMAHVVAISAGVNYTCALRDSGRVECWGANGTGQLGNGTTYQSYSPITVSGLDSGVIAIDAGSYHTCALTEAGGVKCWGDNFYGQLGNTTDGDHGELGDETIDDDSTVPIDVIGLNSGVIAISASYDHTCALMDTGGVKCWGYNLGGQLGNWTSEDHSIIPVDVTGLNSRVISIAAGDGFSCALMENGGVKCWGYNNYGQLGNNGAPYGGGRPVDVVGLHARVIAISAGNYHTCALMESGNVQCWGYNNYGQLGDGTNTNSSAPVDVTGYSDLTLLEHDAHLIERADAIDAALADIASMLDALNLDNLDVAVSSRASQLSVDELRTSVGNIENLITTFDLTNLDTTVSSRASQSSVDALSSSMGDVQLGINELSSRMDVVEQSLSVIESSLNSCQVSIALVPQGEGHNGNSLEFYVHTTLASERMDAESILVWVGGEQVNPDFTSIIPGVTWVMVDGSKWSDLKNQPLTVEVIVGGHTCSSMVVLGNN